ncbi:suppressor APC domain-containing protein 1 isoform X1 [Hypanus sabinus]|uniref:suppressor APC domain-containing protein 1 isoform X1 n=1 Tax=Hypanus sabinus TaxID=79690 RepID=UPI0028C3EFEA|nr:suppressor APC domain-containing protein 1 isoform X1 [Hypanus sabinus]
MPVIPAYTLIIIPLQSKADARNFYLWLKQMKELEQQRDVLWYGLEMVERARDWYHQEIRSVCHRQDHSGCSGDEEYMLKYFPDRGSCLLDKIQHANVCLRSFISCAELVLQPPESTEISCSQRPRRRESDRSHQRTVALLKQQNQLLTKEVSRKRQWIAQLEKENSTLIRRLLDAHFQY